MSWAEEEQARRRGAYEAAAAGWHRAREQGSLVEESDNHERYAGVRWKAVDQDGKKALSAFQLAKSELDHITARAQREAGDTDCPVCPGLKRGWRGDAPEREPQPDTRLPLGDR